MQNLIVCRKTQILDEWILVYIPGGVSAYFRPCTRRENARIRNFCCSVCGIVGVIHMVRTLFSVEEKTEKKRTLRTFWIFFHTFLRGGEEKFKKSFACVLCEWPLAWKIEKSRQFCLIKYNRFIFPLRSTSLIYNSKNIVRIKISNWKLCLSHWEYLNILPSILIKTIMKSKIS